MRKILSIISIKLILSTVILNVRADQKCPTREPWSAKTILSDAYVETAHIRFETNEGHDSQGPGTIVNVYLKKHDGDWNFDFVWYGEYEYILVDNKEWKLLPSDRLVKQISLTEFNVTYNPTVEGCLKITRNVLAIGKYTILTYTIKNIDNEKSHDVKFYYSIDYCEDFVAQGTDAIDNVYAPDSTVPLSTAGWYISNYLIMDVGPYGTNKEGNFPFIVVPTQFDMKMYRGLWSDAIYGPTIGWGTGYDITNVDDGIGVWFDLGTIKPSESVQVIVGLGAGHTLDEANKLAKKGALLLGIMRNALDRIKVYQYCAKVFHQETWVEEVVISVLLPIIMDGTVGIADLLKKLLWWGKSLYVISDLLDIMSILKAILKSYSYLANAQLCTAMSFGYLDTYAFYGRGLDEEFLKMIMLIKEELEICRKALNEEATYDDLKTILNKESVEFVTHQEIGKYGTVTIPGFYDHIAKFKENAIKYAQGQEVVQQWIENLTQVASKFVARDKDYVSDMIKSLTSPSTSISTSGEIAQDQTDIYLACIPPSQSMINIQLHWSGSDLNLIAIDPLGSIFYGVQTTPTTEEIIVYYPADGLWLIQIYGADVANKTYYNLILICETDNIPPTTIITVGDPKYTEAGKLFITSETLFTLIAEDNPGGTGVASTFYRIYNISYNTGWLEYFLPFRIVELTDGRYSIDYYSIDKAGNVEPTNTITIILDNTPPETTVTIGEPKYVSGIIYLTPETPLALSASDGEGSGVSSTAYRIYNSTYDSGWLSYTEPFNLTAFADGIYIIEYYSIDNLGNMEATNSVQVALFSWNYIFTDNYGRGTVLKINLAHKFFQFITPDKDYCIREATYMRQCGRTIIIKHCDNELRLITAAVDTKLDFCVATAWNQQTGKRYFLIDKVGNE